MLVACNAYLRMLEFLALFEPSVLLKQGVLASVFNCLQKVQNAMPMALVLEDLNLAAERADAPASEPWSCYLLAPIAGS